MQKYLIVAITFLIVLFMTCQSLAYQVDKPNPGYSWIEPVTGMEFVWVPGGCFYMGCGEWADMARCYPYEHPVSEVCLDGFWMGKYVVTQGQWTQVMGENPRQWTQIIGENPSYFKYGDHYPVEQVSWNNVQNFIRELNSHSLSTFRLPTESEWEYAARSGGQEEKYAGGDELNRLGWYWNNSGRQTQPVGTKAPNGLGIYDMSGNVWEWVYDWFDAEYYSYRHRYNPQGPKTGLYRVIRGGSWNFVASECRTTSRLSLAPFDWSKSVGFRLVLTPG